MNRRVVITGRGIISPLGNSIDEFYSKLKSGEHGIGLTTHFDTSDVKPKLSAQVKDFNPRDYMENSEVVRSDLFSQYGIAAASQAMAESGIEGAIDPTRLAVYFSSGIGGLTTLTEEFDKLKTKGARRVSPYLVPMMITNIAAGLIAIRFNAKGAAIPVVTACATASNAIGEALRAIRHGYADAAIAGGTEASICEIGVAGFANMQALSTAEDVDAASLPFDSRRAGFIMGEGAGALILEEREHAIARGATIYAELVGYGSTCDAHHMTSPNPDGEGAVRAMRQALDEAGYSDDMKLYINAHGTGTPLNDVTETIAIKNLLGEEKAKATPVSSTKSMTGHMMGAAGAAEALACLLVLNEGIIPPTINLNSPASECDLDYVPNTARKAEIDITISNSLGFGGHNACICFKKHTED